MGRRGVEVEPIFLGVLAVVALDAGEAEYPLLQDRVGAIPEREREAQRLAVVANPAQAVLVPPVRPRPCVVVRKEAPGVAVRAVILADGSPSPFAQIGTPLPPGRPAARNLQQAVPLGVHPRLRPAAIRRSGESSATANAI